MLQDINFRSMNTQIEALFHSASEITGLEREITSFFSNAEQRFSRFLPNSECSRLNQRAGSRCMISHEMANVLELSRHYFEATEGLFDIFILPALERAGYRHSFELIGDEGGTTEYGHEAGQFVQKNNVHMDLDSAMLSVQVPLNQRMDLGGIVKSWTVHRMSELLRREWRLPRGLVNAGGDVEVWGGAADGEPWVIAIDHPSRGRREQADELLLLLTRGAVATSSTQKRSWKTGEGSMHHLIDPRTMRPGSSSVVQCTVVGDNLMDCEIWAKVMCILGMREGLPLFRRNAQRLEALMYTEDGALHHVQPAPHTGIGQWIGLQPDCVYEWKEQGGNDYDSVVG